MEVPLNIFPVILLNVNKWLLVLLLDSKTVVSILGHSGRALEWCCIFFAYFVLDIFDRPAHGSKASPIGPGASARAAELRAKDLYFVAQYQIDYLDRGRIIDAVLCFRDDRCSVGWFSRRYRPVAKNTLS